MTSTNNRRSTLLGLDESSFDRRRAERAVHGSIEARIALNQCGRVWFDWEPFAERNRDRRTAGDAGMTIEHQFRHRIAVSEDEIEEWGGVL